MRRSVLSAVGVVALLGVGVAGIGALMLVKDRLRIEVSLDAPEPDPLALVRDDFKMLQADFVALTQALEQQAGSAAQESARQGEQRAAAERNLVAAVTALDARLAEHGARLQSIERMHAANQGAQAVATPDAPVVAVPSQPDPTQEPPAPQAPQPSVAEPGPGAPSTQEPKPQSQKGFLGFRLPSRSYRFDEVQVYEVQPELSRVGFDAKSTLHDFSGVTTKVRGSFRANLANPGAGFTGMIACEAAALDSGVEGRDEAMREHLLAGENPEITFAVGSFVVDTGGIDVAKMTTKGTVTGTMRIRGVEKQLTMPVTIAVDGSRRVRIEGQAKVHLPDYGVPVPDKVVIKMQPDVDVWIALCARPVAGGSDAK